MEHPIRAAAKAASTPACPLPITTTPYFLEGLIMFHVEPSAHQRRLHLQSTHYLFLCDVRNAGSAATKLSPSDNCRGRDAASI